MSKDSSSLGSGGLVNHHNHFWNILPILFLTFLYITDVIAKSLQNEIGFEAAFQGSFDFAF